MKKLFILLLLTGILKSVFAQAPQGFSYQAAVRNAAGQVKSNSNIKVCFSILDSVSNGAIVYKETHLTTTNTLGMMNLYVGMGTPIIGTFSGVNWGTNAKFLQVEIDTTTSGNNYMLIGVQQLMSVPYALHSGNDVIGSVIAFAGMNIPSGWLVCDGREISRTIYSGLYSVIGTNWGQGNGDTTFNLPDLRGQFLRGVSEASSVDPDATSRYAKYQGGNSSNNVGSYQNDQIGEDFHNQFIKNAWANNFYYSASWGFDSPNTNNIGKETRPKNANVYYIIKY